jgi:hypothetical protein
MSEGKFANPGAVFRQKLAGLLSMTQLVTNPEQFFEGRINSPTIRWEVTIVALVGALSLPGVYYVTTVAAPVINSAEFSFVRAGRLLRPVVIPFLLWIGYALFFHLLANRLRGRGPPGRLLKGTAWALLPLGVGNLLRSAAMIFVYTRFDVESAMSGRDAREQVTSLLDAGLGEPAMLVAVVLFAGLVLWSGYLMTYVVQVAKDIERRQAFTLVAPPVAIHVLFVLLALVQGSVNVSLLI